MTVTDWCGRMSEQDPVPGWALDLLKTARVAHLGTATVDGDPHVIPVCFALVGNHIFVAIDEKPKSGRRLRRLRNIDENPRTALIVDRYDEDWTRLAWVLVRGAARVVNGVSEGHVNALEALRLKYPQYRKMRLGEAELIELSCENVTWWRADA